MRLYLHGTTSNPQRQALFCDTLYFSTPDCDTNDEVSESCMRISCIEAESAKVNANEFDIRWKYVVWERFVDGTLVESDNFEYDKFMEFLQTHHMRLTNAEACFDADTNVHFTEIHFVDEQGQHCFPLNFAEDIEFIF